MACRQASTGQAGRHVAGQLIRSSTSVAANYRAACRARTRREFISKIGIVLEEADESLFWIEFGLDVGILPMEKAATLQREANELVSIFVATRNTATRVTSKGLQPSSDNL